MSTATPARPMEDRIKDALLRKADDLAKVLPRHMTPERMAQVVSAAVFRSPDLQKCSALSIASSVFQAAELGLDLAPALGEAYLIPRWNKHIGAKECTFLPGYKGLVKLARQSGEVASIQARVVREGEHFRLAYTPDLDLEHIPVIGSDMPIVLVYAVAKLANGERLAEAMSFDEIEAVRKRSQSQGGPWSTDWAEMAKKTALRRLCKILPRSLELATAIELDEAEYRTEVTPAPRPAGSRANAIADRIGAPALPPPEPEYDASEGVREPLWSEADDDMPSQSEMDEDADT